MWFHGERHMPAGYGTRQGFDHRLDTSFHQEVFAAARHEEPVQDITDKIARGKFSSGRMASRWHGFEKLGTSMQGR